MKALAPFLMTLALLASCSDAEKGVQQRATEPATLYFSNWEGEIGRNTLLRKLEA